MVFNTMQDKQYSTVVLYYIGDVELDMNFYYTIFDKTAYGFKLCYNELWPHPSM